MPFRPRPKTDTPPPDLRAGTVTRLTRQRKDPQRVNVYLDDAFAFGLAEEVVVQGGVRKGVALTVAAQEALLAEDEGLRARRKAMDLLAYRARSTTEMRRRLREDGFRDAAVETAVERLVELGYLNDAAFANAYVQGRFHARGYGPGRLRADLRQRGLDAAAIDEALDHLDDEALEEVALRHARRAWRRHTSEVDVRKRRKKVFDFLVRRGYDFDLAQAVVEHVATEAAEDEAPDDEALDDPADEAAAS